MHEQAQILHMIEGPQGEMVQCTFFLQRCQKCHSPTLQGKTQKLLMLLCRLLVAHWHHIETTGSKGVSNSTVSKSVTHFMHGHGFVAQKKIHTVEEKMDNFVKCVELKRCMLGITDDAVIVNVDETDVHFSPEFQQIIAEKGSETVSIAKPSSFGRSTVTLGFSKNGTKMPHHVTFTGKPFLQWEDHQRVSQCNINGSHGTRE